MAAFRNDRFRGNVTLSRWSISTSAPCFLKLSFETDFSKVNTLNEF